MIFSDLIFEAIIVSIDRDNWVCSINPSSANEDSVIDDVKLPVLAGNGNAGLFLGVTIGTRVIAAYTSGRSRESAIILRTLPKSELSSESFYDFFSSDIRLGTQAYPDVQDNEAFLRGNKGASISMLESGDILTTVSGGAGSYIRNNGPKTAHTLVSEVSTSYTQAGRTISGGVSRISPIVRSQSQRESPMEIPLFADTFYSQLAEPKGFFSGSPVRLQTIGKALRNPELSEYRHVINEFSTDSMFTGFDDEVQRLKGTLKLFSYSDGYKRNREPNNALHMAEHELIEIIGGNLLDIHGNVLDLNYRELSYGGPESKVPDKKIEYNYDKAKRLSRRGVGYHFQLSTNSKKSDPSRYDTNFAFDIDKEGIFKLNVPKSTNTGNVPFVSNADYTSGGDNVNVSFGQISKKERIPVILRDHNGVALLPSGIKDGDIRETGIRFANSKESPYFPSGTEGGIATSIRVNTTRYHNMYAACEKIFGATIERVYIPEEFVNNYGIGSGNPTGKPFEVLVPEEDQEGETENTAVEAISDIAEYLSDPGKLIDLILQDTNNDGYPKYMSTVGVSPSQPAIYPGGDTVVGGMILEDDGIDYPFSNLFDLESNEGDFKAKVVDSSGRPATDAGGKSANLNFMGSVEASIGADNYDKKSLVLDTQGSIVSWVGKDRNDRSIITQTDGGVFVSIGGTYPGQDSGDPEMNVGRFTMRVNLVDKGFVDSEFNNNAVESDEDKNPYGNSDVVIDISQTGIVIAGMNAGVPMIIRNTGKILIESSTSLVLKGNSVQIVESNGKSRNLKTAKR
jgi:hypothetical protein